MTSMAPEPYISRHQHLQERWRLSHEQQALRTAVKQDIAERWPRLNFDVMPARKVLNRGNVVIPGDDAWFGVGYENGPILMEMRELIAGRTRLCARSATIGSVLWVMDQSGWRSRLGGDGRFMIQPFDLTPLPIAQDINAIDAWAHTIGLTDMNPSHSVGAHVHVEAERAARRAGQPRPLATDARIPDWNWDQSANALNMPRQSKCR